MAKHYSKEYLLQVIKDKAKEVCRTPYAKEIPFNNALSIYARYFGSYNDAVKEAGLKPNREHHKYTKDEIISIIQKTAKKLKRTPTINEIKNVGITIISSKFGSWNNALIEAGLQPKQVRKSKRNKSDVFKNFDEEQIILLLVEWMLKHNNTLIYTDIVNDDNMPSPTFLLKRLNKKTWNGVVKLVNKRLLLNQKQLCEQVNSSISNEELIQIVKNELINLNTISQRKFIKNKSTNIPSWSYISKRLNLSWEQLISILSSELPSLLIKQHNSNKNRIIFDESVINYLKENYAIKLNKDLSKELNISTNEIHKYAQKLRLKKNKELLRNTAREQMKNKNI